MTMAASRYRVVSTTCRRARALGQSSGFLNSEMTLKKQEWLADKLSAKSLEGWTVAETHRRRWRC
jgi:hypothetical protein